MKNGFAFDFFAQWHYVLSSHDTSEGDRTMLTKVKKRLLQEPLKGCQWADKMVLNPALVGDFVHQNTIHMLFRSSGPWAGKQLPGKPFPYPIFLGYAVSEDGGKTWDFDFSRPALAPVLCYEKDKLPFNAPGFCYANGCIEDPRLFFFENRLCLSVACRVFPPGPYWEKDDPEQCMPAWALDDSLPPAVRKNTSVSLLYHVNLQSLARRDYEHAFEYVGPLHEPDRCDNRDVFLFPRRLKIDGAWKIVCVHRPMTPQAYPGFDKVAKPSIFLAAADTLQGLSDGSARQFCLHTPTETWEADRVGGSWAPLEIKPGEWLLPFHGKQDAKVGYTQSFMILQEKESGFPEITHRCRERLFYADEPWELEGEFQTPCLFTCSGVRRPDGSLLMGYGAADSKIGLLEVDFAELLDKVSRCAP
ncbi:MAG: hypothetical protein PHS41_06455 [Victivallaceae bacterium]|nr:hypothetical protein [Victivallaceae bacterium]